MIDQLEVSKVFLCFSVEAYEWNLQANHMIFAGSHHLEKVI